jgi:hypothetical protein
MMAVARRTDDQIGGTQCEPASQSTMKIDWPSGLDRAKLHEREAERWMSACEGLRTATAKVELTDKSSLP